MGAILFTALQFCAAHPDLVETIAGTVKDLLTKHAGNLHTVEAQTALSAGVSAACSSAVTEAKARGTVDNGTAPANTSS